MLRFLETVAASRIHKMLGKTFSKRELTKLVCSEVGLLLFQPVCSASSTQMLLAIPTLQSSVAYRVEMSEQNASTG